MRLRPAFDCPICGLQITAPHYKRHVNAHERRGVSTAKVDAAWRAFIEHDQAATATPEGAARMAEARWIKVLWARSARYQTTNFVAAWPDSLREYMREEYDARVEEARTWSLGLYHDSDGPWEFWVTDEIVTSTQERDS